MDQIGVFSPEQARLLWQDYQTRQQLKPEIRYNFPQRKPIEDVSPHRVKVLNTSEEIIPSFGCMRVVGVQDVGGNTCVKVEKPSSTEGEFLFNSCYPIAVAGESELGVGWAYRHGVVTMLGDEPTEPGATFGPIINSWEIEEGGDKFVVFGRHDFSDRALVGRFATGPSNVRMGIVLESLGCGWYRIELGDFIGGVSDIASASASVECDPCVSVVSAGSEDCGITISAPASRVVGSGVEVTAYDTFSDKILLQVGTDCVLTLPQRGNTPSGSESMTPSGTGSEGRVWQILNGYREHIVEYRERWDCCDPTGPATLIAKTPVILIGKTCPEIECGACPSGSES